MNLVFALIAAAIGFYLYEDITQVPFAELTLNMVGRAGITIMIFIYAFKALMLSFEEDRIWKVEWTVSYFKFLFSSLALVICIPYLFYGAYQWIWGGDRSNFIVITTLASLIVCGIVADYQDNEITNNIDDYE